mmetsp:Transcript_16615/g.51978  ORF Transcript_16615/g.51978 Transcript_16615/m.51978 type:complete len:1637 (+) Transcript_16615:89-4999(+)
MALSRLLLCFAAAAAASWPIHESVETLERRLYGGSQLHQQQRKQLQPKPRQRRVQRTQRATRAYHNALEAEPSRRGLWVFGFDEEAESCLRGQLGPSARGFGTSTTRGAQRHYYGTYVATAAEAREAARLCDGVATATPLAPELKNAVRDDSPAPGGSSSSSKTKKKRRREIVVETVPGWGEAVGAFVEEFLRGVGSPWRSRALDVGQRRVTVRRCPEEEVSKLASAVSKLDFVAGVGSVLERELFNYNVNWMLQSNDNESMARPLHEMGLTGEGQVINVNDDGVDVFSCFFRDEAVEVTSGEVNATNGVYESTEHRKLRSVRWLFFEEHPLNEWRFTPGGHGTHVAGTALGDADGAFEVDIPAAPDYTADGVAFKAKTAFIDMAPFDEEDTGVIYVPSDLVETVFSPSYDVDARISTNSWGVSFGVRESPYDSLSADTDEFLYENQDFVVLFSAGNDGPSIDSLGTPCDAKNAIGVGATVTDRIEGLEEVLVSPSPTSLPSLPPTTSVEPSSAPTAAPSATPAPSLPPSLTIAPTSVENRVMGFRGRFAIEHWDVEGTVVVDGGAVTLVGGDDNEKAESSLTIVTEVDCVVSFSWAFETFDNDGPSWDPFLAGVFPDDLAQYSTAENGTTQRGIGVFEAAAGDRLGFTQNTRDGVGGRAETVVSNLVIQVVGGVDDDDEATTTNSSENATLRRAQSLAIVVGESESGQLASGGTVTYDVVLPATPVAAVFSTCGSDFDTLLRLSTLEEEVEDNDCEDCCGAEQSLKSQIAAFLFPDESYELEVLGATEAESGSYEIDATSFSQIEVIVPRDEPHTHTGFLSVNETRYFAIEAAAQDRKVVFSTCKSNFDTTLELLDPLNSSRIEFNDDCFCCGDEGNKRSSLAPTLLAQTNYVLALGSYESAAQGNFELRIAAPIASEREIAVGEQVQGALENGEMLAFKINKPVKERVRVTISTCGSNFDTVLAVESSKGGDAVENDDCACCDEEGDGLESEIDLVLKANLNYTVTLRGYDDVTAGDFVLSVSRLELPSISLGETVSDVLTKSRDASIDVVSPFADDDDDLASRSIVFSTCGSSFDTTIALYRNDVKFKENDDCEACCEEDDEGGGASEIAVALNKTDAYRVVVSGSGGQYSLSMAQGNQRITAGGTLTGTLDPGGTVVLEVALEAGDVSVVTCGSNFDTVLTLLGSDGTNQENDDCNCCGSEDGQQLLSSVSWTILPDVDYSLELTGYRGAGGSYVVRMIAETAEELHPEVLGPQDEILETALEFGQRLAFDVQVELGETYVLATCGSQFDTVLRLYEGDVLVATNDNCYCCATNEVGHRSSRIEYTPYNASSVRLVASGHAEWESGDLSISMTRQLDLPQTTPEHTPDVAWFSSRGMTSDNRLKPDVVAPGGGSNTYVYSARSAASPATETCEVQGFQGTSMATPAVAGLVALLNSYFLEGRYRGVPFTPMGALVKALIVAAARRLQGPEANAETNLFPNPDQGHGFVVAQTLFDSTLFVDGDFNDMPTINSTKQVIPYNLVVDNDAEASDELRVVLAWYDPPSAIGSPSLVNDLDLVVTSELGEAYYPTYGHPDGDHVNTVERVIIPQPEPGLTYTATVSASSLLTASQPFAFVAVGPFKDPLRDESDDDD